jgi:hypothetical protein
MRTVPRPKRPRERVATPAELEEERRRYLAAKPSLYAQPRETIRDLRADLKRTTNAPAVTMAELVDGGRP